MVLGLVSSIALAHGSIVKALAMVVLGLLLGLVGTDIYTGTPRFTLGIRNMPDGLNFVAVAVGVFGVAEILRNLENEHDRVVAIKQGDRPHADDATICARMAAPILRGTAHRLGRSAFCPAAARSSLPLPPIRWKSACPARRKSSARARSKASPAPESANNAGAQTSFIPMLTLGIPANPVMALMIGAMIIQGIMPGPNVAIDQPAAVLGHHRLDVDRQSDARVLNLPLIGLWVKLLTIPYYVLFPAIMAFCSIGVYSVNSNVFDLYAVAFFGLLGYVLVKLRCEPAPLLLGFVLGPLLEENLRRAMIISRGDWLVFVQRPLSAALLLAAALVLAITVLPVVSRKRQQVFVEED